MKANEVLRRYAEGRRDFQRVNLRGQSFKEKDLSGADFSETDIQGTDFTDAKLKNVNFSHAKAGRKRWGGVFLIVTVLFFSALSGAASGLTAIIVSETLFVEGRGIIPSEDLFIETRVRVTIAFIILAILFTVSISQGLTVALLYTAGTVAGILVVLGAVFASLFGSKGVTLIVYAAWTAVGTGIWALTGVLAQSVAGVVFEYTFETRVKALVVLFKSLSSVAWVSGLTAVLIIFGKVFKINALALPITVAVAGAVAILGSRIGKLALAGSEKHAFIR